MCVGARTGQGEAQGSPAVLCAGPQRVRELFLKFSPKSQAAGVFERFLGADSSAGVKILVCKVVPTGNRLLRHYQMSCKTGRRAPGVRCTSAVPTRVTGRALGRTSTGQLQSCSFHAGCSVGKQGPTEHGTPPHVSSCSVKPAIVGLWAERAAFPCRG